jgi:hypothetical protein
MRDGALSPHEARAMAAIFIAFIALGIAAIGFHLYDQRAQREQFVRCVETRASAEWCEWVVYREDR